MPPSAQWTPPYARGETLLTWATVSLRAWEPVFESIKEAMDPEVYREQHPDWRVYLLRVLGQWFDGIRFYAAASSPRRSRRTWAGLR